MRRNDDHEFSMTCQRTNSSEFRTRRTFFTVTVTSVVTTVAGCLTAPDGPSDRETATGTRPTSETSTDRPTRNRETATGTRPTSETSTDRPPRKDDFYIENLESEPYEIELTVSTDEAPVVDGTYGVPERTGLVFENVGIEGNSYEVVAEADSGDVTSGKWDVRSCEDTEAPAGNRDGAIRIEDDDVRLIQNSCDAVGIGMRGIPYHDADEYEQ